MFQVYSLHGIIVVVLIELKCFVDAIRNLILIDVDFHNRMTQLA
jgi:hypothetical protein